MTSRTENQRSANEQVRNEGQGQRQGLARGGAQRGTMMRYGGMLSPFDLIRRFTEDVDRLFITLAADPNDLTGPYATGGRAPARLAANALTTWVPSMEITTRGDDLVIAADLPGVRPEDVTVEAEGNNLIIRGESRVEQENKDRDYWYSERVYGAFYRSIPLPPGVNTSNIRAEFKNGTLEVTLPGAARSLQPQRQRIAVQSTQQGAQQAQPAQITQQASGTASSQGTAQQTSPANGQGATTSSGQASAGT